VPVPLRLRQVVLVTSDLPAVVERIRSELGLDDPYRDPGVAQFGLENRVFALGNSFLEVLTPIAEGTAGGRYLERRGGDAGYMAIFQVEDRELPRRRAAELGIRVIWSEDLDDISGTHLHPADVGGAIVSLDWADPPESWHWAGPAWTGGAPGRPEDRVGGIAGLTIAAVDPPGMARRWADVLGLDVETGGTTLRIERVDQRLRFVEATDVHHEGIVGCDVALSGQRSGPTSPVDIGGVRFTVTSS
jgi:glyoxalase-like protein